MILLAFGCSRGLPPDRFEAACREEGREIEVKQEAFGRAIVCAEKPR